MRYKIEIYEKLEQVQNQAKTLKFCAETGDLIQYRRTNEFMDETIEEIKTLINTNEAEY